MLYVKNNIPVTASAGCRDDILVEGERDENDNDEEVDGGADGTHAFGYHGPGYLAHVPTAEAGSDEAGPQPADHDEAYGEGEEGQGEGGYQGFAIAVEGVCDDGDGCAGEGEKAECLCPRERCRYSGRHFRGGQSEEVGPASLSIEIRRWILRGRRDSLS